MEERDRALGLRLEPRLGVVFKSRVEQVLHASPDACLVKGRGVHILLPLVPEKIRMPDGDPEGEAFRFLFSSSALKR